MRHVNSVGGIVAMIQWVSKIHGDLAIALIIFGPVTFTKIKLHSPPSIFKSAIQRAMTCLIFVGEVAKLGGNMWL